MGTVRKVYVKRVPTKEELRKKIKEEEMKKLAESLKVEGLKIRSVGNGI